MLKFLTLWMSMFFGIVGIIATIILLVVIGTLLSDALGSGAGLVWTILVMTGVAAAIISL